MLFRKAAARLVASPLFTAFAILSLAAGVAVTTAVYSVVDSLLFRRFAAADAQTVAFVMAPRDGLFRAASVSADDVAVLKRGLTSFQRLTSATTLLASVVSTRNTELVKVEAVDGDYFRTLGVDALVGRVLDGADEQSAARVAVISEEYWRTRFHADRNVTARTLTVYGVTFDIAGVISGEFGGLASRGFKTQVWLPLSVAPLFERALSGPNLADRELLTIVGRLSPGTTHAVAAAEIEAVARQLDADRPLPRRSPQGPSRARQWTSRSALDQGEEDDGMTRAGIILVILVALVLVVACTNLANLVLARSSSRQGELAIRMAMGASRARVICEQCVEGLMLSCLGAAASYAMFVALSAWMTQDFTIPAPGIGRLTLAIHPTINADALIVSVAALLLSLAVFGLEPAVQLTRSLDIRTVLAAGASGIRPRVRRQRMIIRWQVAVATGFFIVATMFIRFTIEQARHDSGVETDQIAITSLIPPAPTWSDDRVRAGVDRVLQEAAKDPAVAAVAASTGLPFGIPSALQPTIVRPGGIEPAADSVGVTAIAATPSLFRVLGITILQGRGFTDGDGPASAPVVVISERAAKQMFPLGSPIDQTLTVNFNGRKTPVTIVGVSRDTDVGRLNVRRQALVFFPLSQQFDRGITITARTAGRVPSTIAALREAVRRADPDWRVDLAGDGRLLLGMSEIVNSAGRGVLYLGAFTLLLSMVGLFGVQSHVVVYRTREFGVRMSLGASARQIKSMVLRDGARPVVDGLILGLWGGVAGRIAIRSYTDVDVTVFDPWMLAVAPVPIVLAALAACYWPAARASRIDPTTALRYE